MKLKTLLEAKFAKPEYAYHATKATNLKSILKHGLIPNKMEDGYGSDETSDVGYSLTALDGVYFTKSAKEAEMIMKSLYDEAIIVILKLQYRDSELDEDRLIQYITKENKIKGKVNNIFDKYRDEAGDDHDYYDPQWPEEINDDLDALVDSETERILNWISAEYSTDQRLIHNVREPLHNYIKSIVDFIAEPYFGDYNYDDSDIKQYQNILVKKLKNIQHGDNKGNFHTFKINKTIGYSGANRIVGFVHTSNGKGWGDIGDVSGNIVKVKHPLEILED